VSATYVRNAQRGQLSSEWRHNENDVIMRTGTAIREWRHNDNSWLVEILRLATCGHGLQCSSNNDWLLCSVFTYDELTVWWDACVTSWPVTSWPCDEFTASPRCRCLACHRPWLKSSLLKIEATFGQFSERILRHSKTYDVPYFLE